MIWISDRRGGVDWRRTVAIVPASCGPAAVHFAVQRRDRRAGPWFEGWRRRSRRRKDVRMTRAHRRPLRAFTQEDSVLARARTGGVDEWLKAHAWKACLRETVTWVRIPLPPPPHAAIACLKRHVKKTASSRSCASA